MLNALRESAHGIFAKLLLGLLVLSFGIWGIGDIFRNGGGMENVATVGKTVLSFQEFSRALHKRQEELRIQLGSQYNAELLRKLGLGRIVRDEMINQLLVTNEAEAMGLEAGDDEIADAISRNQAFMDKDGHFSKVLYLATLKNNGLAEQRYIADLRRDMATRLLVETISNGVIIPNDMINAMYKIREEKRVSDLFLLPASLVKTVPEPSEADIKSWYDAHIKNFMTPEYRGFSYIQIKPVEMQDTVEVSEKEIGQAFEAGKADYHKPERRVVNQMLFASEAEAKAAYGKLAKGESFDVLAKNPALVNKGKTDFGTVSYQDLPEEDAKIVFTLKEGENTRPIPSDFGWHIFHVGKIIPPSDVTLAEARPEIIRQLKADRVQETITQLVNRLSDDMSGGMSMADAAAKNGRKVITVNPVSREGIFTDGKKSALPANLVTTAFALAEKQNSEAMETLDGTYAIVRTDHIIPETARPLAEVRDKIIASLKAEKNAGMLAEMAKEWAAKLRAGKKVDNMPVAVSSGAIRRTDNKNGNGKITLPYGLVADIFKLKMHEYSNAYPTMDGSYMIASLQKVVPAPASPDPKILQALSEELKNQVANQTMDDYLHYLRNKYPITVNDNLLNAGNNEGSD